MDRRSILTAFFVGIITVSTLYLASALYWNWLPILHSGYGWDWHYQAPTIGRWRTLLPFFVTFSVYGVGAWHLRRAKAPFFLAWVVLIGAMVLVAGLSAEREPLDALYERTVAANVSGAFRIGVEFPSGLAGVRDWSEIIDQGRYSEYRHIRLSPPGLPLLFWLTGRIMEWFPTLSHFIAQDLRSFLCDQRYLTQLKDHQLAAITLGVFSPLLLTATVIPLYIIGRKLDQERAARLTAFLWIVVPSVLSFVGTHNSIMPLVALLSLLFFDQGWRQRSFFRATLWYGIAGFFAFFGLLLNLSIVPLFLLQGCLTLFWVAHDQHPFQLSYWMRALKIGLQYGVGVAIGMILYRLFAGYNAWELLPNIMRLHLDLGRPYYPWLGLHLREIFLFIGLPVFLFWLSSSWLSPDRMTASYGKAMFVTLAVMIISGTAQGEVARVWIFLLPIMLFSAVVVLTHYFDRRQQLWLIGLQLLWLIPILVVLRPILTYQPLPPNYEEIRYSPLDATTHPVAANFKGEFLLEWYQAIFDPATKTLTVTFGWSPQKQLANSYFFSVLMVDPKQEVHDGLTWLPLDYRYPTTCWHKVSPTVVDRVQIELKDRYSSGEWWLSLSAVSFDDQAQPTYLPVTAADGTGDSHQIGLGPIVIP